MILNITKFRLMNNSLHSTLIDDQISLVIDVTYRCNAKCLYCQWGSKKSGVNLDQPDTNIFIPKPTLKSLGTERIVFSGGEPLLRKDLEDLISYYSDLNLESIIVITNGLILTPNRLDSLINSGLTGITFSLDGISENIALNSRGFTKEQHYKILDNLNEVLDYKRSKGLELGINTVVSRANLDIAVMDQLIQFCNDSNFDWIKFNPVFDDGYLGNNAPLLKLRSQDSNLIRKIGNEIIRNCKIKTNPLEFWETIVSMLEGKKLLGSSCGLDTRQAIVIRGKVKFCFWIDNPIYGLTTTHLNPEDVRNAQLKFNSEKKKCETGMYCFCLQKFDHKWELTK